MRLLGSFRPPEGLPLLGRVAAVIPGTPAAEGGLKKGDFVTGYQGKEVQDTVGLRNMVAETAPGIVAKMKALRDKKPVELSIKIGKLGEREQR